MPKNNSDVRIKQRREAATQRLVEYAADGRSVAQREADRGYPQRLNSQQKA